MEKKDRKRGIMHSYPPLPIHHHYHIYIPFDFPPPRDITKKSAEKKVLDAVGRVSLPRSG